MTDAVLSAIADDNDGLKILREEFSRFNDHLGELLTPFGSGVQPEAVNETRQIRGKYAEFIQRLLGFLEKKGLVAERDTELGFVDLCIEQDLAYAAGADAEPAYGTAALERAKTYSRNMSIVFWVELLYASGSFDSYQDVHAFLADEVCVRGWKPEVGPVLEAESLTDEHISDICAVSTEERKRMRFWVRIGRPYESEKWDAVYSLSPWQEEKTPEERVSEIWSRVCQDLDGRKLRGSVGPTA